MEAGFGLKTVLRRQSAEMATGLDTRVAERQGQTAARNILGQHQRFDMVPFFWTSQYDFTSNYVGHAQKWEKLDMEGSLGEHECKLSFRRGGRTLAVVTVGRDRESPEHEIAMEKGV